MKWPAAATGVNSPVTTDPLTFSGALTFSKTGKTAVSLSDSGAQNSGITIGGDTNIYRGGADLLTTDDGLVQVGAPVSITADTTLALTHAGRAIEVNAAGAVVLTVPPNSSVAYPIGTTIEVNRYGAGAVTFLAGGGVTIRSKSSLLTIGNRYGSAVLRKRGTDEWILVGDLA